MSSHRWIIVHDCGRDREPKPGLPACTCTQRVSGAAARDLVDRRRARWWKRKNANGYFVDVRDGIVMLGGDYHPARSISADDIESAFVENRQYARDRIELFDARKGV